MRIAGGGGDDILIVSRNLRLTFKVSINGGNGNDVIGGGDGGFATLLGGRGNDVLTAGRFFNYLDGGADDDILRSPGVSSVIHGGGGFDRAISDQLRPVPASKSGRLFLV